MQRSDWLGAVQYKHDVYFSQTNMKLIHQFHDAKDNVKALSKFIYYLNYERTQKVKQDLYSKRHTQFSRRFHLFLNFWWNTRSTENED